ncbi:MAG TPA: trypsin-like peptidase domain-containing protein [Ktedonobacterales bacterium]|jgi:S1-C subfamily serine protease|nr:trypsin-like peptidase domain-containing protein [Ktedonobacterales bacterium]
MTDDTQQTAQSDQGGAASALGAFSDQLANAFERASRSIVSIAARPRQSASGVLWKSDGGEVVIVTADHVLEREDDITVIFPEGHVAKATLAGRDPSTDLAVLRLPGGELGEAVTPIEVNDNLRPGHLALAIGRPTEGGPRVSFGVVSAVEGPRRSGHGAQIEGVIFADVTLYPGFSGGPLVDLDGRMVGLTSSRLTRQSAALPLATVRRVVGALLTHGRMRRGYLGVGTQQIPLPTALAQKAGSQQESALLVVTVEADSPAEQAGLLIGDLIVSINGQSVTGVDGLRSALAGAAPGQALALKLLRGGEPTDASVTVGERA